MGRLEVAVEVEEDPLAVTVHLRLADLAEEAHPAPTARLPTEAAYPPLMEHHRAETEVAGHPPAMARQPEAAADSEDHLRLTVHLAPVVAVSEAPVDILEAEVVTLEVVEAVIPEVVATLEAAGTAGTLAEAVTEGTLAAVGTAGTLEVAMEATLEAATVATLEAEVVTLEAAEVAAIPGAEVARATPATEVTNTNQKKSSPRAATFDLVPLAIEHHRAKQRDLERSKLARKTNERSSVSSRNETESEAARADSKSSPEASRIPIKSSTAAHC